MFNKNCEIKKGRVVIKRFTESLLSVISVEATIRTLRTEW